MWLVTHCLIHVIYRHIRVISVFKLLIVSTVLQKLGSPLDIIKQLTLNQVKNSLEKVSSLLLPMKKEI